MPWYVRGSYAEGWAWLTELLALPGAEAATLARANALIAAGHLAYCQGEYGTAERLLADAGRLTDRLGDHQLGGVVLHVLASVARGRGDLARARSLYGSALAVSRRLGHQMWEATVLSVLANVFYEQGEHAQAGACAEESLALFTETGNTWGVARSLYALGRVAGAHGEHTKARSLHQTSLALERELADHQGMAWSLVALANEVVRSGDGQQVAQRPGTDAPVATAQRGLCWLLCACWSRAASHECAQSDQRE
jgi:tetratricopeptide (TPR) repeat protein